MKDTTFKSDPQEPLVPAEVSFTGYYYVPLDIKLLTESDISFQSGDGYKATIHLLAKSWQETPATSLPDDDRRLALLAGFGKSAAGMLEWAKVKDEALSDFVLCSDGRLYSRSLQARALEAWENTLKRQGQTKKGREKVEANRAKAEAAKVAASRPASVTEAVIGTVTERKEEYIRGEDIIGHETQSQDVDVPAPPAVAMDATATVTPRASSKFEGKCISLSDVQVRDLARANPNLIDILGEIATVDATMSRTPPMERLKRLTERLKIRNNDPALAIPF